MYCYVSIAMYSDIDISRYSNVYCYTLLDISATLSAQHAGSTAIHSTQHVTRSPHATHQPQTDRRRERQRHTEQTYMQRHTETDRQANRDRDRNKDRETDKDTGD